MSVTLAKTPRAFTVLIQLGTITDTLLTPTTDEGYIELVLATGFGDCVELFDVTATDRYEANERAMRLHARATAIESYMVRAGASYREAHAAYRDSRTWARALTTEARASWFASEGLKHFAPLKRFALIEAMHEFGEPTA
ncbi:hypothetical protein [Streptomyces sp. NPDC050485]|uniref:hypothetical protein n=1 Tax=Streptomyces sp. NPDC050485 TaxID=3365617 RepID=UPI0037B49CC5